MPTGIEVRRSADDAIIITNLQKHPQFLAKGSVTSVANTETDDGLGSICTVPSSGIIRGVLPPDDTLCHMVSEYKYWLNAAAGATLDWWSFSIQDFIPVFVGIEAYDDATGDITFNSNPANQLMKVVNTGLDTPAGKTYCYLHGGLQVTYLWEPGAKDPGGTPDPDYYALIRRVNAFRIDYATGDITIANHRIDPAPNTVFGDDTPNLALEGVFGHSSVLAIDVTGY